MVGPRVYTSGYRYRLFNHTRILGLVVLALHAVLATAVSVWQLLWRGVIIKAWSNTPAPRAVAVLLRLTRRHVQLVQQMKAFAAWSGVRGKDMLQRPIWRVWLCTASSAADVGDGKKQSGFAAR